MESQQSQRFRFSTDKVSERDRFPLYYEEIIRSYMNMDLRVDDQSQFQATIDAQRVGAIDIAFHSHQTIECTRSPQQCRDGHDGIGLILLADGVGYQTQRGIDIDLAPGEAMVSDYRLPGKMGYSTAARHWSLTIPRAKLAPLLADTDHLASIKFDRNAIATRLLFLCLNGALGIDFSNGGRATELYERYILDLFVLSLGAAAEMHEIAEERGVRDGRRLVILQAIRELSGDPGLSAVAIAARLGITPRYVHLLLEDTGRSFSQHVLEKRLDKAAALLRDPLRQRRKIAEIALEAGFVDLSYFNRAFRRSFGMTPSDMREAARRDAKE